ncbi:MAG: MetQ/NlpA family ABC transporter substrate-binding protein [Ancrocorticia sp.]|uniref:MetQ/NlpA family ABC transporter substrate-binding protein n=1 Tax=Ancrocorticia sp. TaxID=2593684 RepID=UPI003F90019B
MKRFRSLAALGAAAALTLSACGGNDDSSSETTEGASGTTKITVGASPVPHSQILEFVQENLAEDAGIEIEISEYQDYVLPNTALQAGEIDANFFQHIPYYDEAVADNGFTFERGEGVHIEPFGVYSNTIDDIADLPDGAKVAVTNDPSNQSRALYLLEDLDLLTLEDVDDPTIYDVADNPNNLELVEAEAPAVPKLLPDVDIAIINGNFALQNDLVPSEDAIYLEEGEGNPYSNILAWNSESDPEIVEAAQTLDELLHSQEVADFITETWPDGEVIPSF